MYRFVNPDKELRIAGGREAHLGSLQALGLYAANSLFVGDYLTTQGQAPEEDYRMIEERDSSLEISTNSDSQPTNKTSAHKKPRNGFRREVLNI